jgi:hypothetical protein
MLDKSPACGWRICGQVDDVTYCALRPGHGHLIPAPRRDRPRRAALPGLAGKAANMAVRIAAALRLAQDDPCAATAAPDRSWTARSRGCRTWPTTGSTGAVRLYSVSRYSTICMAAQMSGCWCAIWSYRSRQSARLRSRLITGRRAAATWAPVRPPPVDRSRWQAVALPRPSAAPCSSAAASSPSVNASRRTRTAQGLNGVLRVARLRFSASFSSGRA